MLNLSTTCVPVWRTAPGLTEYQDALATMLTRVAAIRDGAAPELVWLVEHPALYTAGTSAQAQDLLYPQFPIHKAGRGGQWTYHGPGQRVVYCMFDLQQPHGRVPAKDIRAFIAALEGWIIAALARLGVRGEVRADRIGIWVVKPDGAEQKIAAIGLRVSRWVSWHGFALNVTPDLAHFNGIVPCGIADHGITSLAALGVPATLTEVDAALAESFPAIFA